MKKYIFLLFFVFAISFSIKSQESILHRKIKSLSNESFKLNKNGLTELLDLQSEIEKTGALVAIIYKDAYTMKDGFRKARFIAASEILKKYNVFLEQIDTTDLDIRDRINNVFLSEMDSYTQRGFIQYIPYYIAWKQTKAQKKNKVKTHIVLAVMSPENILNSISEIVDKNNKQQFESSNTKKELENKQTLYEDKYEDKYEN